MGCVAWRGVLDTQGGRTAEALSTAAKIASLPSVLEQYVINQRTLDKYLLNYQTK
jgi:hypothetical protein